MRLGNTTEKYFAGGGEELRSFGNLDLKGTEGGVQNDSQGFGSITWVESNAMV